MAIDEASAVDVAPAPESEPQHTARSGLSGPRAAGVAFGVYLFASFFISLHLGRRMWFYQDDWHMLLRNLSTPAGLLNPFNQTHWVTIPLLVYHVLFWLFGLHYAPYQICTIVLHLALAVLIRTVMRRAGVGPWLATITASIFVLFGPGYSGILDAIQVSLVGSAVFGVCHLLLADHDGPFARRDLLGLVCGLLGIMSSGIGTVMIIVVGIAVLIRRGWRLALIHTVPLAVISGAWYVAEWHLMHGPHSNTPVTDAIRWNIEGERAVFGGLGGFGVVAIGFGVVLVVGLALAWRPFTASVRKVTAAPLALLLGGPIFFTLTSVQRGYIPHYETASKFINIVAGVHIAGTHGCGTSRSRRAGYSRAGRS